MAAPGETTSLPIVAAPGGSIAAGFARLRRATATERREWRFALVLLMPAILMIGTFVAYPFVRGIWLSLTDTVVGREGEFVGVNNFAKLWSDSIFQQAARNTVFYTAAATLLKL
ncbi:MAG TPA: hypothetical protein VLH58_09030, partial [Candidatus Methylomirabilis sp.]|nr:hypothetical protein [Candidatus Methylomirabilis sp.]